MWVVTKQNQIRYPGYPEGTPEDHPKNTYVAALLKKNVTFCLGFGTGMEVFGRRHMKAVFQGVEDDDTGLVDRDVLFLALSKVLREFTAAQVQGLLDEAYHGKTGHVPYATFLNYLFDSQNADKVA